MRFMPASFVARFLMAAVLVAGFACQSQAAPPRSYRRAYDNHYSPHHRTYAQRYGLYQNGSYARRNGLYSNRTYAQRYGFPPHGSYSQRYGLYSYGYAPYRLPYLGVNWFWPYYGLPGHGFATRGAFHPGFAYYGCYGYRGYRW